MRKPARNNGLIREFVREALHEAQKPEIKTIGDLKKIITQIQLKKAGKKGVGAAADVAVGAVLDLIPGAATAKNVFDIFKATFKSDDSVQMAKGLKTLNIDDDVLKITDDALEDMFLQQLKTQIDGLGDEVQLSSINIDKVFSDFLAKKFNKRTVAGF